MAHVTLADRRSVTEKAQSVLKAACDADVKLATAESCTGGLLAALMTGLEGVSHALERGFVVYTDEAKHELLGVPQAILDGPGAVSEDCAVALAEGALERSRADYAISITGYAGPAEPGAPSGLVHFALASKDHGTVHRVEDFLDDTRDRVRFQCLHVALDMLQDALKRF